MDYDFWIGFLQIIWIDILLSGDNAVVIALACRSLPPKQRRLGIALGAAAAIALRIVFATFVVYLMSVPLLKIVGGLLLFWIALKLVLPDEGDGVRVSAGASLVAAVRSIVIADAVMSLDNVIGIAAASEGDVVLLVLGLLISVPLILCGSTLILHLVLRFPVAVYAGGGLLGWIAGGTIIDDPVISDWVAQRALFLNDAAPTVGALATIAIGWGWARVSARERSGG
jgi:YjbE family integral membrane protein